MGPMLTINPNNFSASSVSLSDGRTQVKFFYKFRRNLRPLTEKEMEDMKSLLPFVRERIEGEMTGIFKKLERVILDEVEKREDPIYTLSVKFPSFWFYMDDGVHWDRQHKAVFAWGKALFTDLRIVDIVHELKLLGYGNGFFWTVEKIK